MMLADRFPELARQVTDMDPATLATNSSKKPLWQCTEGHPPWRTSVANRTRNGSGCPYCSGLRKVPGVNDLAALYPEIAATYSKSNTRELAGIAPKDNRKYLWDCPEGHTYDMSPAARTRGSGCPYCAGQRVLAGFNDIGTTHPAVAAMWTGRGLPPTEVTPFSRKRIELRCARGHVFEVPVMQITLPKSAPCPVCSGRRLVPGVNDLATMRPEIAALWDGTGVGPPEVTAGSSAKMNLRCDQGHRWTAAVHSLTRRNGTRCPTCAGNIVDEGRTDLATLRPDLAAQWHPVNDRRPEQVGMGSGYTALWRCAQGHEWQATVYNRAGNGSGCRRCWAGRAASVGEDEVSDYIAALLPGECIERHAAGILGRGEMDIYLPDRALAVEYNGLFWHSEGAGKDRHYHRRKVEQARERGIRLIMVWEDDWHDRRAVVEQMLAARLGVDQRPRIGARKCDIDTAVGVGEAADLLAEHHIQGPVRASYRYGLRGPGGGLVAVMCLRKMGTDLYMDRYATAVPVPGGFTRLLSEVRRRHSGLRLVTFSDESISDGDLYRASGFCRDGLLAPDYTYLVGGERRHKFGYRKARFQRDPGLLFEEGLTEKELADLNGLCRVWDAGKVRWTLDL